MRIKPDHYTNYPEDAAAYERWRGSQEDADDRPTKAEIDREEATSTRSYYR